MPSVLGEPGMVVGHSCLLKAARLLAETNPGREPLAQAAELCWLAGFWSLLDWPEEFREQYGRIFRPLLGPWTFAAAIEAMDDQATRRLAETLTQFVQAAIRESTVGLKS
jgi:hypothetical protein